MKNTFCGIIDNRSYDDILIDKVNLLSDAIYLVINRINRLYRDIGASIKNLTFVSKSLDSKFLNEYTDVFAKEIKQINYSIRKDVYASIMEFINSDISIPIDCDTNTTEYNYYVIGFLLECGPSPRGTFRKMLNITKLKRQVINRAEELKSDGDDISMKFYGLVTNLRELELYLISLLKEVSKLIDKGENKNAK